ncbi:CASP-like protein 4A4 [Macadamia integrifolia]|uniref:CASP-like protein 4A4 n=1 Tax=Macadamia integrifolia TaxID=60698 RepID=UPI001C4F1137|nr:CASP-like protein 4A4 [Macadamia integrifolia]
MPTRRKTMKSGLGFSVSRIKVCDADLVYSTIPVSLSWYSFGVTILSAIYSASQLYKGVYDIVHRSRLISDLVPDYLSFILMAFWLVGLMQQLPCYLLISSSSLSVPAILRIESGSPVWKATIVSLSMSFAAFLVFIACSLLSGYKLCKRIIW